MKSPRLNLAALVAALSLGGANARAQTTSGAADTSSSAVQHCVELHERARIQRVQEQWLLARESMTQCAADSCPLALRVDCQDWLVELANALPTLLIVIERADGDVTPVELEIDGRAVTLPEPLGPLELLPGKHHLRARMGASLPLELDFTLEKGEKNHVAPLRFARALEPAPKAQVRTEAVPAPKAPSPPREPRRPVPALTYWLAGGALGAFATSGVLLGSALSSLSRARDSCAPGCDASVRRSIDTRLLAADVFGGVGVALSGLSLYTLLARRTETRPAASPNFALLPGGASLTVTRSF